MTLSGGGRLADDIVLIEATVPNLFSCDSCHELILLLNMTSYTYNLYDQSLFIRRSMSRWNQISSSDFANDPLCCVNFLITPLNSSVISVAEYPMQVPASSKYSEIYLLLMMNLVASKAFTNRVSP